MTGYRKAGIAIGCVFRICGNTQAHHRIMQPPNYETWLNQIVSAHQTHMDGKDRTFSRFLLDLPHVPPDVLHLLRESCTEADR